MAIAIDPEKLENAAQTLKSMAHPLRIAIIELLAEKRTLNVTQIHETLRIEQAVASHHLSILKSKDIISSKRNGKQMIYSLRNRKVSQIMDCMERMMTGD